RRPSVLTETKARSRIPRSLQVPLGKRDLPAHLKPMHKKGYKHTGSERNTGDPRMPSPFPGMDPFLEDEGLWPVFQHQLVTCLYQILLPGLVDRYRARVVQRLYTTEQPLFTSIVREEHREEL